MGYIDVDMHKCGLVDIDQIAKSSNFIYPNLFSNQDYFIIVSY